MTSDTNKTNYKLEKRTETVDQYWGVLVPQFRDELCKTFHIYFNLCFMKHRHEKLVALDYQGNSMLAFSVEVRQKYSVANHFLSCLLHAWKSGTTLRPTFWYITSHISFLWVGLTFCQGKRGNWKKKLFI